MKQIASYFVSAAAAASMLLSANAQTGKKVVLMEQYTGAWCGWCVDGSVVMNAMEEKYGDRFIGVKIHQGDAMEDKTLTSALSAQVIPYYPAGGVDRAYMADLSTATQSTKIGIGRDKWEEAVERRLQIDPAVEVGFKSVDYDFATGNSTINVTAKFLKDVTGDVRFNLYVIEDSVSGTGPQYDQKNFLSGNANFVGNPYYSLPATIIGYQHREVVRKVLGGAAGTASSISSTKKGDIAEYAYTFKVPANYKPYHVKYVVVAQLSDADLTKGEILNAAEAPLSNMPVYSAPIAMSKVSSTVTTGENTTSAGTLSNSSDKAIEVKLEITNTTSIPSDWNVSLKESVVTVPAKGTANIELIVKADNVAACLPILIKSTPQNITDGFSRPSSTSFWVMSDNARYAVFAGTSSDFLLNSTYKAMTTNDNLMNKSVAIPLNVEIMKNLPMDKLEMGVFNLEGFALDEADVEGTPMDIIGNLINNKKHVLVTGLAAMSATYGSEDKYSTDAARDFYEKELGITLNELTQRYSGNTLTSFILTGIDGDPVGDMFYAKCNTSTTNSTYSLFTESMLLRPNSTSVASLYFDEEKSNIAAVRNEKDGRRIVYMGFSPLAIASATLREDLLSLAYNYLLLGSTTSAEELDNAISTSFATPNPSTGNSVTLSFESTTETSTNFTIVNALGQLINSFEKNVQNGTNSVNVSTSSLSNGAYTAVATINGRTVRIPFVVAK